MQSVNKLATPLQNEKKKKRKIECNAGGIKIWVTPVGLGARGTFAGRFVP